MIFKSNKKKLLPFVISLKHLIASLVKYQLVNWNIIESTTVRLTLNIIKSFLNNRTQYVEVKGVTSKIRASRSSVPQGSVLGTLLDIIAINDLPNYNLIDTINVCPGG